MADEVTNKILGRIKEAGAKYWASDNVSQFMDEGDDQVDDSHENRSSVMGAPSNMTVKARDATNRMSRFGDADVSRTSVVERVSEFLTEGKVSKGAPPATLAADPAAVPPTRFKLTVPR